LNDQALIDRARALDSILEAVGRTPLMRLQRLEREVPGVELHAKLEYFNPGGSVKDRAALQMIRDAEASGELTRDRIIIDSTSGNTGVAYSMIGAALGYRVVLVMPSNVSAARKQIITAYGTEIIYSDPMEGSDGAIRLCRKLVDEHPDRYFYPDQYSNEGNPGAHQKGTAREILEVVGDRITHFVAGLGTSGTAMGTGRGLKAHRPSIQVLAVEPEDSFHGLEGLKHMASSLVPAIFHQEELDETLFIPTEEGWDWSERLSSAEGLLVGHSAGAAMAGAMRVARRLCGAGQPGCVVTVFPDRSDRYFEQLRWERSYQW
jgi:cysteine synthase B